MWKTTLLFLIAVLLTPGLTLMLGGCAWSCQPTLALKPSMSAAHIKTFPAGAVESLGLGCERRL